MTIQEWQNNPGLTAAFREITATPAFIKALEVLENSRPSIEQAQLPSQALTENAEVLLGRATGYELCLQRIKALAVMQEHVEEIAATYGSPTEE